MINVHIHTFMVSSKEKERRWEFDFIGQEEAHRFDWILTTIDEIPEKQVFRLLRKSAEFEQTQQVRELAVNVA